MPIKAICFDADGVVVNPQLQFSRFLEKEHAISAKMTQDFFRGVFNDCLTGVADLKEVLPSFLKEWGWKTSVDDFVNTWLLTDHVIDQQIIREIHNLRLTGMVCCLTTNQENYRAEYMKNSMGFQNLFDHLFFSCEIGWQKPNHEFFHHIKNKLNLEMVEILLWDDSYRNIQAARDCGWHAEIYTSFNEFKNITRDYIGIY